ncbi:MAG: tannase/feruloyl esterase family alpha/beta hydrolase [Acidobacteriota bacterium]
MRILLVAVAIVLIAFQPPTIVTAAAQTAVAPSTTRTLTEADCTAARIGVSIPRESIGEPVASVTLTAPTWTAVGGTAYCAVVGAMGPVDTRPSAKAINFRVVLPASWDGRAIQIGGGGNNGVIPNLTGPIDGGANGPTRGVVTFGSDSGHQMGPNSSSDWSTNDEAIRNLGFMQMKKTHDAAVAVIERAYGSRPRFTYYVGTSQGGREALTVAQRYPADYNGIVANVPIVNFSSLMLAPELIRIQEKPVANWVTRAKVEAIRSEFMRQCDALDGLVDGVVNNYVACRAIFDVKQGAPNRSPWSAKRCPNNVDPNPADTTPAACLTDGQISTLQFVYSRYAFATPLANGVRTFGMWVPNTDPSGSGLIADQRFVGQEGATADARLHSHLGVLGVTGFLMKDPTANPLDYVEGGPLNKRREELSPWLDSTDPNLSAFERRGGRMIVTIGTDDTLASPGAQLDYYQSVLDRMGRATVDRFARLFVIPQTNHGLQGRTAALDGQGRAQTVAPIPNTYDKLGLLMAWVENGVAPPATVIVRAGDKTLPLCGYPQHPHYVSGPIGAAESYRCRE